MKKYNETTTDPETGVVRLVTHNHEHHYIQPMTLEEFDAWVKFARGNVESMTFSRCIKEGSFIPVFCIEWDADIGRK